MLNVVHLRWADVDDAQWSVLSTRLDTRRLAPYGCLSWHSRRAGATVRVTALWDGPYGVHRFITGPLVEAGLAAGLDDPEVRQETVRGVHHVRRRTGPPAPAVTAADDAGPVVVDRAAA